VDFPQHTRFSTDPAVGFVELWVDAQPITLANGQTRYPCQTMLATHTGGAQFFLNNYHAAGMAGFADETIYFDEAKVGTTRQSVEIPR